MYDCPCTQWSVRAGDVSWKNPRKKRRNKEQEVAFENKDVKSSRNSKKHTLTKGSLLSIVLQEGKGTNFWEKEMGFGVHTDRKWQPPSWEGRGRRLKCEAKQILHVTKEVHVRIWCLWRDAGTRNICSEILPQKQKGMFLLHWWNQVFYPRNLKSCGSLVCCHFNFKRLLSYLFQFPAYSISPC